MTDTPIMPADQELLTKMYGVLNGTIGHAWQGLCPDDTTPDDRDPHCEACQIITRVEREILGIDPPIKNDVDLRVAECCASCSWVRGYLDDPQCSKHNMSTDHYLWCNAYELKPSTADAPAEALESRKTRRTLGA